MFKHCHIAAPSFHPLKTLLVWSDLWLGILIALFPLHSSINSFPITVSKINFLSLFVKSYSVYLHPIQSSSTQWFASIFLHALNAWLDPLFLVYSKHKHLPITPATSWKPSPYCFEVRVSHFQKSFLLIIWHTVTSVCISIYCLIFLFCSVPTLILKPTVFLDHILTSILKMSALGSIAYFFNSLCSTYHNSCLTGTVVVLLKILLFRNIGMDRT